MVRRRIRLVEGHLSCVLRPAAGPTLVLIPGSFSSAAAWDEVAAGLPPDISLVIVELRGHGDSWPPPPPGASMEDLAADVLVAADALGLERFFIGGHSIGGMVAIEVARMRPAAVRGVISVEGWTSHEAREAFPGDISSTLSPELRARKAARRVADTARWTQQQIADFASIWTRWDGYDFLAATDLPILEIWGDRGRPAPSLAAARIPDRPNIEVVWMANASHSLPLERPRELAAAMAGFIGRVQKGAG